MLIRRCTVAVIKAVNDRHSGVVFLLWGGYAAKKGAKIDKVRFRLQTIHPIRAAI
jgi:uracil-DNA glycosylase